VIALRDEVRAALEDVETRLRADERAGTGLTPDQIRSAAEQHLDAWCAHDVKRRLSEARQPLTRAEERALRRSVLDRLFGLGELQPLLDDPETETIVVNGPDRVFLHRSDGTRRLLDHPIADSPEELIRLIQRLAAREGLAERPWDSAHPALDLTLRDGSRLHAMRDVVRAPSVTIRRHRLMRLSLDELVRMRTLHPADRELVEAAILAQQTVMVCGGPAAGKSTTLRGLATAIPPERRIVSIEATLELHLDDDVEAHPDCVAMQTRSANLEGRGELSSRDLFREALRMSPDVLIVGEVRGPQEALPMLMSVAAGGAAGSLSTIHARSSAHALAMLQTYVLMGEERLPFEASAPLIASSIDLVLHVERRLDERGGEHRVVASVREVCAFHGPTVTTNEVSCIDARGQHATPVPLSSERRQRLHEAGYRPTHLGVV
jgi:Flp pilus assembly CpaF family ATPase